MINIILCVDDIHPEEGYGFNDIYETNLKKLMDAGIKPTLFVVPHWRLNDEFKIENHKDWIKGFGKDVEWAIHGYAHHNEKLKEEQWLEFKDISKEKAIEIIDMARYAIKDATGQDPKGIRFPGWYVSQENFEVIIKSIKYLDYYAMHIQNYEIGKYEDTNILPYTIEVHKLDHFKVEKDDINIILHSHISEGETNNENSLNDENTEKILKFIEKLKTKFKITFKTASELVSNN